MIPGRLDPLSVADPLAPENVLSRAGADLPDQRVDGRCGVRRRRTRAADGKKKKKRVSSAPQAGGYLVRSEPRRLIVVCATTITSSGCVRATNRRAPPSPSPVNRRTTGLHLLDRIAPNGRTSRSNPVRWRQGCRHPAPRFANDRVRRSPATAPRRRIGRDDVDAEDEIRVCRSRRLEALA